MTDDVVKQIRDETYCEILRGRVANEALLIGVANSTRIDAAVALLDLKRAEDGSFEVIDKATGNPTTIAQTFALLGESGKAPAVTDKVVGLDDPMAWSFEQKKEFIEKSGHQAYLDLVTGAEAKRRRVSMSPAIASIFPRRREV